MSDQTKTVFSTSDVARICKVAPRTVSKWFDSGRLRGYRIPGCQERRIPREHLIRFLKEHGMPLGELEAEPDYKSLIDPQQYPPLSTHEFAIDRPDGSQDYITCEIRKHTGETTHIEIVCGLSAKVSFGQGWSNATQRQFVELLEAVKSLPQSELCSQVFGNP